MIYDYIWINENKKNLMILYHFHSIVKWNSTQSTKIKYLQNLKLFEKSHKKLVFQKKRGLKRVLITNYKWRMCPQCELYTLTNKLTQFNATTIQMKKKPKQEKNRARWTTTISHWSGWIGFEIMSCRKYSK